MLDRLPVIDDALFKVGKNAGNGDRADSNSLPGGRNSAVGLEVYGFPSLFPHQVKVAGR
jgi:hypothetical protein